MTGDTSFETVPDKQGSGLMRGKQFRDDKWKIAMITTHKWVKHKNTMKHPYPLTELLTLADSLHMDVMTIKQYRKKKADYNVVYMMMFRGVYDEVLEVKKIKPKDTIFIGNIDYAAEVMQFNFGNWVIIKEMVTALDICFVTQRGQKPICDLLRGEDTPTIYVPYDEFGIQERTPFEHRRNVIASVWHRWDDNRMFPALAGHGIVDKDGNKYDKFLLGYSTKALESLAGYTEHNVGQNIEVPEKVNLYDKIAPMIKYQQMLKVMGNCKVIIEGYTLTSMGRIGVECAFLKVPCVGYRGLDSCLDLFPDLAFEYYDVKGMHEVIQRLVDDKEFYDEVVEKAWKGVQRYRPTNVQESFYKLLENYCEL